MHVALQRQQKLLQGNRRKRTIFKKPRSTSGIKYPCHTTLGGGDRCGRRCPGTAPHTVRGPRPPFGWEDRSVVGERGSQAGCFWTCQTPTQQRHICPWCFFFRCPSARKLIGPEGWKNRAQLWQYNNIIKNKTQIMWLTHCNAVPIEILFCILTTHITHGKSMSKTKTKNNSHNGTKYTANDVPQKGVK